MSRFNRIVHVFQNFAQFCPFLQNYAELSSEMGADLLVYLASSNIPM